MAKSVDDRGRGARLARRDEGAYCCYVTEEQRSQLGKPGCIGREGDRLSHSRALSLTKRRRSMVQPEARHDDHDGRQERGHRVAEQLPLFTARDRHIYPI
jgi:hypothetical protein